MAKADMVIQINVSAPGLEIAIKALTDAILQKNGEVVIPEGSAVKIEQVQAVPQQDIMPAPVVETPQPAAAPVPTAPVQQAQPAPAPVQQTVPTAAPATAPVQQAQPAPVQTAVAPATPTAPALTLDAISAAGAQLIQDNPDNMQKILGLLPKYNVPAINLIKPEQFEAVAADLRALGAKI